MHSLTGELVLYCSAVLSHCLCVHGNRKKLVNKSGTDQSSLYPKVRVHTYFYLYLTLTTYILYYTPHPFLSQENDGPHITEPIRAHSLVLYPGSSSPSHDSPLEFGP